MEAKEFRIGNLILNDGCLCRLKNIYGGTFNYCTLETKQGNEINSRYEFIKPIPFTEEILLKCGFSVEEMENKMTRYQIEFRRNSGAIDYLSLVDCSGDKSGLYILSLKDNAGNYFCLESQIKYLHQLQNLCFALWNKELEINI